MTFFRSASKKQLTGLLTLLPLLFLTSFSPLVAQNKLAAEVSELHNQLIDFPSVNLFDSNKSAEANEDIRQRDSDLEEFELLRIQPNSARQLITKRPLAMMLSLPDPSGGEMVMELVRFDLLAPDFEAIEMPSGNRIDDLPESVFYRGVLTDDANSVVIISVTGDEVSGLISKSDQSGNLNLVHLEGGDYLLYDDIQIKDKFDDIDCETISPEETTPSPSLPEDITATGSQKVFGCFGIHLDIGHQIFDEQGSSSAAISFMEGVFAQVTTLFENEQINITIASTTVWTAEEPFLASLGEYRGYRAANNVNASLAHYVHSSGSGGGSAYVRKLCDNKYGYGRSNIFSSYEEVPNYSYTVLVISHELGHNFGSEHTHDCVWNNNNTPIDGCSTNNCGSTASIPSDGGTIMSYCHNNGVGVNFSKGFGPQPGDRIRAHAGSVDCNTYSGCEAYSSCDVAFTNGGCRTTTIYWNNNGNLTSYRNLAPGETFSTRSYDSHAWVFKVGNETVGQHTVNCLGDNSNSFDSGGCIASCLLTFENTGCSDVNVWTRIDGNWQYYTKMSPNETYQPTSEEGVSWEFWYNTTERAAYYTADCSGNLNYNIETRGCSTSGPLDDGVYAIYARHSNQVISTASSGINNGTNIIQYPFGEHFGQRWRLSHLGNDVYRITNEHSNRVMDVAGVSQNSGANVHIWSDFNADNQKWKLKNIGGGYFNLIAEHSGKCLNVSGGSTAYFTSLIQWDCLNGSTNDDFRFTPLSESLVSELPPLTEPSELEVLPNPATDEVSINFVLAKEYKNGTVTLRDIQGRVVENLPFQGFAGKHELRLDIRNFKSGIYIISLRTEELILNKRLVIRQ